MAQPTLRPASKTSNSILPSTGTHGDVVSSLPYGVYSTDAFVSGAVDQVSYTYKKLGGDVLDIELDHTQIYTAYEEAVFEYSYIVNLHQAKSSLGSLLGNTTASFDQDGQINSGETLKGKEVELAYPRFEISYPKRVADLTSAETNTGGTEQIYSASFTPTNGVQNYDMQQILATASSTGENDGGDSVDFSGIGNKKVIIRKVYYKTPHAMWRFFGYYGGINVLGNMSTYGQFADDSTFQIVPVWQNKLQAMAFEDALYTRTSHWSYRIVNNNLRIFPYFPDSGSFAPDKVWVEFSIPKDAWEESDSNSTTGIKGINNLNTLPFENLPYDKINSMGKQWVRRFALSLSKEMLGQIRSKFSTIPIPGESVTLNGSELVTQAREEQDKLREELKTVLDELTYSKLVEQDATTMENANKALTQIPYGIYQG